jgi:hypothetical protein
VLLPGVGVVLSVGDGDGEVEVVLGLVVVPVGEGEVLAGLVDDPGAEYCDNGPLLLLQAGVLPDELGAVG